MEQKQLGKTTLSTAPVIFGGNIFGWTVDQERSFELLDAFTEAGFNAIDTADVYSAWVPGNKGGESESIIGNWHSKKRNRSQLLIATKTGADRGSGPDLTANHILEAVELSLQRLQTDYIDLYQSHYDNPATPVDETLEAYAQLIKSGKVRFIGTSNMKSDRIETSLKTSAEKNLPRYETLQPLYNLYDREKFETEYKQLCLDNNISAIPYYALASGFLTGKYRSEKDFTKSKRGGNMHKYLDERGLRILDALDTVSSENNAKPAQVAIAWLLAQPAVTAAIASATSLDQLGDLSKGSNLILSEKDIALLTTASEYI